MKLFENPIEVKQTFPIPAETVWRAITDVTQMRQWFFEQIPAFEPAAGFHTEFDVQSGGRHFLHIWTVTDVEPLKRIRYDWRYRGYPGNSFVTFELTEQDSITTLTVTHTAREDFPNDVPEFQRESGVEGWTFFITHRLKLFLEKQAEENNRHGTVAAVCKKSEPGLPKLEVETIELIENHGVAGDYHAGKFVRHRYLAKKDPTQPNVRQVLLADTTIFAELAEGEIDLLPGMLGENIVVDGLSVMALPIGARLVVGETLLEVTEIRNPCYQLNGMHPQLLKAVAQKIDGTVRLNAGIMARILRGGQVHRGDTVQVQK